MKLLSFKAVWCPACLVMKPILNNISKKYQITMENYDYDMDSEMVEKWNIGNILPVLILIDENEKEINRLIGEKSEKEVEVFINENKK